MSVCSCATARWERCSTQRASSSTRCFDALNLSDPDRVAEIHHDYVRGGADLVETNTFGANRIKLRAFGLTGRAGGDQCRRRPAGQARRQPQRLCGWRDGPARDSDRAVGQDGHGRGRGVLPRTGAGAARGRRRPLCSRDFPRPERDSVGDRRRPERVRPPDRGPDDHRRGWQQSRRHATGAVCAGAGGARRRHRRQLQHRTRPRCSRRSSACRRLRGPGWLLNPTPACPATSKDAISICRRRNTSRRTHGGLSRTACGSWADAAVPLRSTSAQIKTAVRALAPDDARSAGRARAAAEPVEVVSVPDPGVPAVPRAERSQLARALADGRFATIVQLLPPKGHVGDEVVDRAQILKIRGIDVVHIPDGPRGSRMSALSLAVLIQQQAWIETVLQYSCRDRNLLGMQSDLLGAHAMGTAQPDDRHGGPAQRRRLSGRHRGLRRRLDRAHQRRVGGSTTGATSAGRPSAVRPRFTSACR